MKLPRFNTIGEEEWKNASRALMGKLPLSGYIGGVHTGGYWVERLSKEWSSAFKVPYAIPCNSATSGLLAACMAAGIGAYDDVWITNYSMSATAACAMVLGADVTFVDIESNYFGLDIDAAPKGMKPKALIVTNLFGHPAELREIRQWCDKHSVVMIEDNAQAPFAMVDGRYAGTIGHMGVFSLNVHKHIQCGEGGIVVTKDELFGAWLPDVINHGELRGCWKRGDGNPVPGLNLRMTEVTAAIACAQLKKAKKIVSGRIELALRITEMFRQVPEVIAPYTSARCHHVFYVWAGRIFSGYRDQFVAELNAHGFPIRAGYTTPLNQVFGVEGEFKMCKEVESQLMTFEVCAYDPSERDLQKMADIIAYSSDIVLGKHRAKA